MKPDDKQLQKLAELYSWNETCLFLNQRVRELKTEIGKANAYIEELEDKLKVQNDPLTKSERKALRKELHKEKDYQEIQKRNRKLRDDNKSLRDRNNQLLYELNAR